MASKASTSSNSSFEILADIAQKSIQFASGLPAQNEAVELWNGIGFTIAGTHFVAPMGSVSEILHPPKYTTVPGVKNWMLGIANVRGRLLPILDLALFFDLKQASLKSREKRVLIVEHGEILSGFVVDSVHGMQYFSADSFQKKSSKELGRSILPFVKGAYEKNKSKWNVFDTFALTENENFIDVAVT
jgi:twitching motility protein PilI